MSYEEADAQQSICSQNWVPSPPLASLSNMTLHFWPGFSTISIQPSPCKVQMLSLIEILKCLNGNGKGNLQLARFEHFFLLLNSMLPKIKKFCRSWIRLCSDEKQTRSCSSQNPSFPILPSSPNPDPASTSSNPILKSEHRSPCLYFLESSLTNMRALSQIVVLTQLFICNWQQADLAHLQLAQ